MRGLSKTLKQHLDSYIESSTTLLYKNGTDNLCIQHISLRKVKGENKYNILVSVDGGNVTLNLIKEVVEDVCSQLDLNVNKISIEL